MKCKIPAIFLHIQKTAGSSIVDIAAKHYGNKNISSHADHLGKKPEDFKHTTFISGHFGYDFARFFLGKRFSFTFLRNPVDRVVSFYYFCKSREPEELPIYKLANENDFERFIDLSKDNQLIRERIWNSQAWRIAQGPGPSKMDVNHFSESTLLEMATEHLSRFDFVGTTETFQKDFSLISEKLNFPVIVQSTKTNITKNRPRIEEVPKHIINKIENITQLDAALYHSVKNKSFR